MRTDGQAGAILLAGGKGSRLFELTARTCKPAVPLGADTLIVDWTLSNLRRSRIFDITAATQYMPARLEAYLEAQSATCFNGRLRVANGVSMTGRPTGYHGTADAVRHVLGQDTGREDDPLLIVAADHVYEMDYRPMIAAHRNSGAGITVACTILPAAEARSCGVVAADASGKVEAFVEKPATPPEAADQPGRCLVSMGIYVCDRAWLRAALARGGDDFGYDILPAAVARGEAYAYRAVTSDGAQIYWRDVGTLDVYRAAAVDLALNPWRCPQPMHALGRPASAEVRHWARRGSVVLPGATVEPGADLHNVIVAPGAHVPSRLEIGHCPDKDRRWFRVTPGGTTLVTAAMLERRLAETPEKRSYTTRVAGAEREASSLGT